MNKVIEECDEFIVGEGDREIITFKNQKKRMISSEISYGFEMVPRTGFEPRSTASQEQSL